MTNEQEQTNSLRSTAVLFGILLILLVTVYLLPTAFQDDSNYTVTTVEPSEAVSVVSAGWVDGSWGAPYAITVEINQSVSSDTVHGVVLISESSGKQVEIERLALGESKATFRLYDEIAGRYVVLAVHGGEGDSFKNEWYGGRVVDRLVIEVQEQ